MTFSPFELIVVSAASVIVTLLLVWQYWKASVRQINADLSRNQFEQKISEVSGIGVVVTDGNGRIRKTNELAEVIFGYQREELTGANLWNVLLGDQIFPNGLQSKGLLNSDDGVSRPLRARRKDGRTIQVTVGTGRVTTGGHEDFNVLFIMERTGEQPHEDLLRRELPDRFPGEMFMQRMEGRAGKPVVNYIEDLQLVKGHPAARPGEREFLQKQLKHNRDLASAVAQHFPNGLIIVLDTGLRYMMVNGKEAQALGMSTAELIGKDVSHGTDPLINAHLRTNVTNVLTGVGSRFEIIRHGSVYNVNGMPLFDEHGSIYAILLVIENITKKRHLEKSLYNAIEQERKLSDLKVRFVTMASHEFRTPLSTILSSLFFLERYEGSSYEENKYVHINRIKRTVNTLTETLNDFLRLGKLEEGRVEIVLSEVNIREYAEETIRELQSVCRPGQTIVHLHDGLDLTIFMDKYILRGILSNLLSNAIKYSPESLEIELRTAVTPEQLRIEVADHGIGIPAEEQERIFERFFRALNASNIEGTGLGLHIVKRYLELLNGAITFSSDTGGTTFFVTIPLKATPEGTSLTLNQDR